MHFSHFERRQFIPTICYVACRQPYERNTLLTSMHGLIKTLSTLEQRYCCAPCQYNFELIKLFIHFSGREAWLQKTPMTWMGTDKELSIHDKDLDS